MNNMWLKENEYSFYKEININDNHIGTIFIGLNINNLYVLSCFRCSTYKIMDLFYRNVKNKEFATVEEAKLYADNLLDKFFKLIIFT